MKKNLLQAPIRQKNLITSRIRMGQFRPSLEMLENRTLPSVTSTIFALDPPNSSLTLSGTINGSNIQQQGAGSLSTRYSGALVVQWDLDAQSINFVSVGSAATAANSGSWQPNVGGGGGSAPANYGATASFSISICSVTARVAVRNLVASSSTAAPLSLTPSGSDPYTFASTQTLAINAGSADYSYSTSFCGSGAGTTNIGGNSAQNQASSRGVFQDQGNGDYALIVPINVTISQTIPTPVGNIPVVLHIIGTLTANAAIPLVTLNDGSIQGYYDYATSVVATQGPVNITDPAASITRTPNDNLTSMTVTLLNSPDGANEFLAADLSGTPDLSSAGYDPASGTMTITGVADPSEYGAALQTITYENDNPTPDTSDRQIQVVATDSTNASVVRTSTVSVIAPGGAPGRGTGLFHVMPLSAGPEIHPATVTPPVNAGQFAWMQQAAIDLAMLGSFHSRAAGLAGNELTMNHLGQPTELGLDQLFGAINSQLV